MSDKQARVSRYAQAVFQIMVEKWQASLNEVSAAVARDESLASLLSDAGKDGAAKVAALEAVLPAGLPVEVANFVKVLAQEGDFALLPQVSASLSQTASGRSGPTKADIVSAVELSAEEQAELRRKLAEAHGDGLVYTFSVDPALMGGLRVRVGDKLIDTSVASRLASLRESLASVVR
jgi:F-type H+-transporting ATPase subunit delta